MSTLTFSGAGPGGNGALINSSASHLRPHQRRQRGGPGGRHTIGGSGNITLASVVSGSWPLTYAGSGTLALSTANTYSGGTIINPAARCCSLTPPARRAPGTITDNGTLGVGIVGNNVILANAISGPGIVNIIETAADNLQLGGSMSGFTGTINCPASPRHTPSPKFSPPGSV